MHKKILFVLLLAPTIYATAQDYVSVEHLYGTEAMGNNEVTVAEQGNKPFTTHFDGVAPFQIGNKGRVNGYDFTFGVPVKSIRIQLAGINSGEFIEVGINGQQYHINANDIERYSHESQVRNQLEIVDGLITYTRTGMASATITITPGYSIKSVYVHHLNGLAGGVVFSLSCPANVTVSDNSDVGKQTTSTESLGEIENLLSLYPNPNTGEFVLTGNGFTDNEVDFEIMNAIGQKVYDGVIVPNNHHVNQVIKLGSNIANGNYIIHLKDGMDSQNLRFTISR